MTATHYGLTQKQLDVLSFIERYASDTGLSPSIREITHALDRNSSGNMYKTLRSLKERGYLAWLPGKARSFRVLHPETDGTIEYPVITAAIKVLGSVERKRAGEIVVVSSEALNELDLAISEALRG